MNPKNFQVLWIDDDGALQRSEPMLREQAELCRNTVRDGITDDMRRRAVRLVLEGGEYQCEPRILSNEEDALIPLPDIPFRTENDVIAWIEQSFTLLDAGTFFCQRDSSRLPNVFPNVVCYEDSSGSYWTPVAVREEDNTWKLTIGVLSMMDDGHLDYSPDD
jgi:hypothetical protein